MATNRSEDEINQEEGSTLGSDFSEEDTNAPVVNEAGVQHCLELCGLTHEAQRQGWIDEGMNIMEDICTFRPSEVYDVGANLQKLAVDRGGSRQGRGQLRKIEALVR